MSIVKGLNVQIPSEISESHLIFFNGMTFPRSIKMTYILQKKVQNKNVQGSGEMAYMHHKHVQHTLTYTHSQSHSHTHNFRGH